jgi:uncharacterized protein
LKDIEHRPWELPTLPWAMQMIWHDLAFLHWPVEARSLQRFLPPDLEIDTFDGRAWLGVVPFRMSEVCPARVPRWLGSRSFPELNVRTYVRHRGVNSYPGVWFFSLDAASWLGVRAARLWYGLPYYDARISLQRNGEAIRYESRRTHRGAPAAELSVTYQPVGPPQQSQPSSFEYWLTERYALYSARTRGKTGFGQTHIGHIHHRPWPLQPGKVSIETCDMTRLFQLELPKVDPVVHVAREIPVVAWGLQKLATC